VKVVITADMGRYCAHVEDSNPDKAAEAIMILQSKLFAQAPKKQRQQKKSAPKKVETGSQTGSGDTKPVIVPRLQ
jgi:hypothetical protein